jgi:hypothetical protein
MHACNRMFQGPVESRGEAPCYHTLHAAIIEPVNWMPLGLCCSVMNSQPAIAGEARDYGWLSHARAMVTF